MNFSTQLVYLLSNLIVKILVIMLAAKSDQLQNGSVSKMETTTNDLIGVTRNKFQGTFQAIMRDIFNAKNENGDIQNNNLTKAGNAIDQSYFQKSKIDIPVSWDWLKTVVEYNVPKGKHLRGQMVELTFKALKPEATEEEKELSRILGWIIEILHASCLIADDLMDGGDIRRGQPCWHCVDNKGVASLNDAFLLEHAAFQILRHYFKHLPCYMDLPNIILGIEFRTILGQSLDIRTSRNRSDTGGIVEEDDPFATCNLKLYNSIVRYKTGYYTCYLPIALAMCLAEIPRNTEMANLWKCVEKVTLEIGYLFQVQDDFIDCFGDEKLTGKVGMDIQEGKCTWLFVTAKEILTNPNNVASVDNGYKILQENYGKSETVCVDNVKQLYRDLDIPKKMQVYQEQACGRIVDHIGNLNHSGLQVVLTHFFDLIYKRKW